MAIRMIAPGLENQWEYRIRRWSLQHWRAIPELADRQNQILAKAGELRAVIEQELQARTTTGRLRISREGQLEATTNPLLTFVFSTFSPRRLGIIEFNPAERKYPNEQFSNVTVDIGKEEESWKQSAMYNTEGKYGGIKSALGNEWVRTLIQKAAGVEQEAGNMAEAVKQIFNEMIPEKRFEGARPTKEGQLEFNVQTGSAEHDIDDLSSGEKEILFGYLRTTDESTQELGNNHRRTRVAHESENDCRTTQNVRSAHRTGAE